MQGMHLRENGSGATVTKLTAIKAQKASSMILAVCSSYSRVPVQMSLDIAQLQYIKVVTCSFCLEGDMRWVGDLDLHAGMLVGDPHARQRFSIPVLLASLPIPRCRVVDEGVQALCSFCRQGQPSELACNAGQAGWPCLPHCHICGAPVRLTRFSSLQMQPATCMHCLRGAQAGWQLDTRR